MIPHCESETARHEAARRGLQLIGSKVARTPGKPSPIPAGVCPTCWAHGQFIPLQSVGPCIMCDDRAEKKGRAVS